MPVTNGRGHTEAFGGETESAGLVCGQCWPQELERWPGAPGTWTTIVKTTWFENKPLGSYGNINHITIK